MLPDFVCKADELALDLDLWSEAVLRNFPTELTADQISGINSIDRTLLVLTHMGSQHWTENAVRKSLEWQPLRTLAACALESFGWPLETPPSHADEFIGGP